MYFNTRSKGGHCSVLILIFTIYNNKNIPWKQTCLTQHIVYKINKESILKTQNKFVVVFNASTTSGVKKLIVMKYMI